MFSKKRPWLAALIVLGLVTILLTVVGCGGKKEEPKTATPPPQTAPSTPAPAEPAKAAAKSLIIALPGEPTSLDPQIKEDGNMRAVTNNVFEQLTELDGQTLQIKPSLATKWEQKDDITWRFTLRQGVKFHNGDTFSADDAVFSIKRMLDPATKSEILGWFGQLKDARKVDDYTIDVITDGPSPNILMPLTLLPILDAKYTQAKKPEELTGTMNGTGPYVQDGEWKRGQFVNLKRNEAYWGPKPDAEKVQIKFLEETGTRLAALVTGEVDVMLRLLPEYVAQVKDKGMKVAVTDGIEFPTLRLSQFRGIMKDQKLRLAVNYAIDREGITKSIFGGYATPAAQMMKPGFYGYNPDLKPYPYDPEKAKQLLKEAGYKGQKIQLYGETGRWFKSREAAEAAAAMLQAVGMNIEVKIVSWQEYLEICLNREKAPDIMYVSAGNELFDADKQFMSFINSKGALSSYLNPDLDKKIADSHQVKTIEERERLQKEIGKAVYDDPWAAVIANNQEMYGLGKKVDWKPRQDGKVAVWEMKVTQ